jgi:hypothetical protein
VVVKKWSKSAQKLRIFVNFCSKSAQICQFPASFCSFLPSFLAQKCDSPIKSRLSLLPKAPNCEKAGKNACQALFLDYFTLLLGASRSIFAAFC